VSEFRGGWPLLLAAFIGIATGVSSLYFYSLGIFLKPIAQDFGWSRGAASLGPLVGTLGAAIASAPTGLLMDRVGPVRTAIGAMLLLATAFAALAIFTHGLASFLIIAGLLSFLTVGSTPLSYTRLLVSVFDKHRGLALGLALTGTGIGAFFTPVLLGPFIAAHGWRAGYFALAATVLIATAPTTLLLLGRGAPKRDRVAGPPLREVAGRPDFILFGVIFLLGATAVLGAVVHLPAMLSDQGLSPGQVGPLVGSIGIAVIVGRAAAGLLLDRAPARLVTAGFFTISGMGLVILGVGGARWALPGALALGLSVGAEVDLIAYLVSRRFPANAYGAAYGGIYALFLLGGAIGPALLGAIFNRTGTYLAPFETAAALLIGAAVLALRIPAIPRRIGEASPPRIVPTPSLDAADLRSRPQP
jgi:MFS family permease